MQAKFCGSLLDKRNSNNSRYSQMPIQGHPGEKVSSLRESTDEIIRKARQESMEKIPILRKDQSFLLKKDKSSM